MVRSVLYAAFALALAGTSLLAASAPQLKSVTPPFLQRGVTTVVAVAGANLRGVTNTMLSGPPGIEVRWPHSSATLQVISTDGGIRTAPSAAARAEDLSLELVIAPDAPLGARELRLHSPDGLSNPVTVQVTPWREYFQAGNSSQGTAQELFLPAAFRGTISTALQTNFFRFHAEPSQPLAFEVASSRNGSPLDSSLAVIDATGKELARDEDTIGFDSRLIFHAPAPGEYFLTLRDFRYQGGAQYIYRLLAGPLPVVESIFPLGGRRGTRVEVELSGVNLETNRLVLDLAADAAPGVRELRAQSALTTSVPFLFDVQDLPEISASAAGPTNTLAIPVIVNGRITTNGPGDEIRIQATADQKIEASVWARRLGSPLDGLLTLSDTNGAVMAHNDDGAGIDPRLEFDVKKGSVYVLRLRDVSDRSGTNFAYRLVLRPVVAPGPELAVRFFPDVITVHRGGAAMVRCEVTRTRGDGPVRITLVQALTGLRADPLLLGPGVTNGYLRVEADATASEGVGRVTIQAEGTLNKQTLVREAMPIIPAGNNDTVVREAFARVLPPIPFSIDIATPLLALDQDQSAAVASLVTRRNEFAEPVSVSLEGFSAGRDPLSKSLEAAAITVAPVASEGNVTIRARTSAETGTRLIFLKATSKSGSQDFVTYSPALPITVTELPFLLNSAATNLTLTAGGSVDWPVKAERRGSFTNEIQLALGNLPTGVTVASANIAANATEAVIKLTAATNSLPTNFVVSAAGTGEHNDRRFRRATGNVPVQLVLPAAPKTAALSPAP